MQIFFEIAYITFAGAIAAFVSTRFKLPTILGYIVAGVFLGLILPTLGYKEGLNSEFTSHLAEIGIALLLFAAGIEFSLKTISSVKSIVIIGSILQILFTILFSTIVLNILGLALFESVFIGSMISMSSTAFVLRMLESKQEMHAFHGKILLGWLIMQDIIAVAIFLLLGSIAPTSNGDFIQIFVSIVKAIAVIGLALGLGKYLMPYIFTKIAETGSREVLLISVVAISVGFAFIAELFGVSFTLGSFLAGLALSETFLKHEIFSEIKPVRDLFTLFFFVSIGSLLNFTDLAQNIGLILTIVLVLLTIKMITIFVIVSLRKVHTLTGIRVATGLSQIGEFAFLGITIGLRNNWIDNQIFTTLIVSTIVSMALTPVLFGQSENIYKLLERFIKKISKKAHFYLFVTLKAQDNKITNNIHDHIVVCGYGKVGSYVVKALMLAKERVLVIEMDAKLVERAKADGVNIVYGDATSPDILEGVEISEAKMLIITLPSSYSHASNSIIRFAKEKNSEIKIIVREREIDANLAKDPNVFEIVEPEFESAVRIVSLAGKMANFNRLQFVNKLRSLRKNEIKDLSSKSQDKMEFA